MDSSLNYSFPTDVIRPFSDQTQDESMRVTYEDPKQRDEKLRLLNLLSGECKEGSTAVTTEDVPIVKKGKNLVRRSSRKSGF